MVAANMDGPTRDQVLKYMEEKERIEREIQALHLVLETNHVGMNDPLVDQDGYPRGDINIYQVRHARHQIVCLQNDHKAIMRQIERGLYSLHAQYRGEEGTSELPTGDQHMDTATNGAQNGNGTAESPLGLQNGTAEHIRQNGHSESRVASVVAGTNNLRVDDITVTPIVKVNFVSPGSPAESAGICVDDEIFEFGSVNASNFRELRQIGEIVQHSVGSQVAVKIRRGEDLLNVTLVPGPWSGRGLLGCNIVPV